MICGETETNIMKQRKYTYMIFHIHMINDVPMYMHISE